MRAKYLIMDNLGGSMEGPVIFPAFEDHGRMAMNLGGCHNPKERVVAAGFVQIYYEDTDELKVCCFGKSDSLGIESRGDVDAELVRRMLTDY